MKYIDKERDQILADWRANKISMVIAARRLHYIGYAPLVAWQMVEAA